MSPVRQGNEEPQPQLQVSSAAEVIPSSYSTAHYSAWVAHGAIGATAFGLLVPLAITSALVRDLVPTYWIYLHVSLNVVTFAATFFGVGIAFATKGGMAANEEGEGHFEEMHHLD
eukprot:1152011_1